MTCPDDMVEPRIDRVLTQYRESPKLLHMLRTYLSRVEEVAQSICRLPEYFALDTAVGDQLTLIGKRLGWPRCHCVCILQPVFGFECASSDQPIAGLCESNSTWMGCGEFGTGEVCINDDDLYRRFLKSRVRQAAGLFSRDSLEGALIDLWGPTARLLDAGHGRVIVAPGRALTSDELSVLQLYPRVLPVVLGIEVRFHFGSTDVFGFGDGWTGFNCETTHTLGMSLITENGRLILDEVGNAISTGPFSEGTPWMCQIDVRPYTC